MSLTIRIVHEPIYPIPPAICQALAAGWMPGPPTDLPDDALDVDTFTATVLPCERCNATGGQFRAVHQLQAPAYRAWSCCRECGHATEM